MAFSAWNGLGLALVIPCVQSLLADMYSSATRGRAFGLLFLTSGLGALPPWHLLTRARMNARMTASHGWLVSLMYPRCMLAWSQLSAAAWTIITGCGFRAASPGGRSQLPDATCIPWEPSAGLAAVKHACVRARRRHGGRVLRDERGRAAAARRGGLALRLLHGRRHQRLLGHRHPGVRLRPAQGVLLPPFYWSPAGPGYTCQLSQQPETYASQPETYASQTLKIKMYACVTASGCRPAKLV